VQRVERGFRQGCRDTGAQGACTTTLASAGGMNMQAGVGAVVRICNRSELHRLGGMICLQQCRRHGGSCKLSRVLFGVQMLANKDARGGAAKPALPSFGDIFAAACTMKLLATLH
jgi:hypothetical protein